MIKAAKKISALLAVAALAIGLTAMSAPSAKAYVNRFGGFYNPPGVGPYNPPGFGGAFVSPFGFNPISQWIVLSGLFNPYFGGAFY